MKKYTKEDKRIFLLYVGLVVIALINAYLFSSMGYGSAKYFMLLLIGLALVLDVDKLYYLMAFCLPISSVFKLSNASISVLPILYFVVIIKLFMKKKVRLNVYSFVCMGIFVVLQLFAVLVYGASIVSVVSLLLNIFCVMCSTSFFAEYAEENYQLQKSAIFFVTGAVLDIALSDLFPRVPYVIDAEKMGRLQYNNRFAALNMDPNEYSQLILIAIGLLVAIFPILKSKTGKIFDVIVIAYLCVNGYRSYSKSYVLTLIFIFAIALIMFMIRFTKRKGFILASFVFVPVAVVFIGGCVAIYQNVVLTVFEARESFNTDMFSGRDYIWAEFISALKQRVDVLLVGCGTNNSTFLHKYCALQGSTVAHNLYLEFLIQFGIVGILLFAVIWKDVIKNILKNKMATYMILPLAAFLITSMSISANANDCLYVLMLLMCMPYNAFTKGRYKHLKGKNY